MDLSEAVARIRPAVRAGRAYHVDGPLRTSIKLNQNESPFDLPEEMKRVLIERFWHEPFNRYPQVHPIMLQDALGKAVGWNPEGILVGNGSNELIDSVNQVLVSPGDAVVLPSPMFSFYARVAELYEADVVTVQPCKDLSFDAEAIARAASDRNAALVVFSTPSNPTGLAMSLAEVRSILAEAPGFVLIDEAYGEFSREESPLVLLEQYPNMLLLRTFSKAFGLAGMRVGYLIGHVAVVREIMKARTPFMVHRLSEITALALLERPALVKERIAYLKRGTRWLHKALNEVPGVEALKSQTNFVLFRTPKETGSLMTALTQQGVLIRNMSGYAALQGYLRVNTGTEAENKTFLRALIEVLR